MLRVFARFLLCLPLLLIGGASSVSAAIQASESPTTQKAFADALAFYLATKQPRPNLTITGAFSAAYYDPQRSGEGVLISYFVDGSQPSIFFGWYTYDESGNPIYLVGSTPLEPSVNGRYRIENFIATRGARFGTAFNSGDVTRIQWGSVDFFFAGCNVLAFAYRTSVFSDIEGGRHYVRIGQGLSDVADCLQAPTSPPAGRLGGANSGVFYNDARNGEGVQVATTFANGRSELIVVFYTYDLQGNPIFIFGSGAAAATATGSTIVEAVYPRGPLFGPSYNANDFNPRPWGTLTLRYLDCDTIDVSWTSSVAGFTPGQSRMTRIGGAGVPCSP